MKAGRLDEAERLFRERLSQDPRAEEISALHLATLEEIRGNWRAATTCWPLPRQAWEPASRREPPAQTALSCWPDNTEAKGWLAQLESTTMLRAGGYGCLVARPPRSADYLPDLVRI